MGQRRPLGHEQSFYWYLSVVVIVAVHVVAMFLANRRLTAHAPDRTAARRAENPWLIATIAYTAVSLFLIASHVNAG